VTLGEERRCEGSRDLHFPGWILLSSPFASRSHVHPLASAVSALAVGPRSLSTTGQSVIMCYTLSVPGDEGLRLSSATVL
jgi:hypothetical protein